MTTQSDTQLQPKKNFLQRNLMAFIVLAAFILFPFVISWITGQPVDTGKPKFWQGQLIAFFIMAVYTMSYDLLMGYIGILSFGHAAFFGVGAYTMALWLTHVAPRILAKIRITLPGGIDISQTVLFIIAILLVVIFSVLMGLLFSGASVRVSKRVYFAMITLAIAESFHILSKATDFVKWTGADEGLHGVPVPVWINPTQHRLRFYFIALAFMVVMFLLLKRATESPTGKIFIAIRENDSRVRMIGYNPAIYRSIAFSISAVAAGLAGAMFSLWNMSATPSMTSALTTINALIMTILGGVGTLTGPILGAGLMQIFSQFFYQWFGPRWPLVFGLIFIAIVIFLPYGIVGTWRLRKNSLNNALRKFFKLFSKKK
jgi:branched-chain amino acid transport system permease protein